MMASPASASAPPTPFPSFPRALFTHLPPLRRLEELLRCHICYELYSEPTMTANCGHNFCSLCVRKHLVVYKQQCPQCLEPSHESELRPNRAVKEIQRLVVEELIPKLSEAFRGKHFLAAAVPQSPLATPKARKKIAVATPTSSRPPPQMPPQTPTSTQNTPVVPSQGQEDVKKVPCPVCSVDVPERNINCHLDKCLKDQHAPPPTPSNFRRQRNGMKPMQKIVYHLVKDADLRKKLREEGLDTKGDRKTLIARHQKFVLLWNAQCDSDKPLSRLEIKMQLQKEEQAEKKIAAINAASKTSLLDYDRNTEPEEMQGKKQAYLKQNRDSFQELIRAARKGHARRKAPATSDNNNVDDGKCLDAEDVAVVKEVDVPSTSKGVSTPAKSSLVTNGELYITPKRKSSRELAESLSPKRLKQTSLNDEAPPSPSICPVCSIAIAKSVMNAHLDTCLQNRKKETVDEVEEDELSEGWKNFFQSSYEVRIDESDDQEVKIKTSSKPSDEKENEVNEDNPILNAQEESALPDLAKSDAIVESEEGAGVRTRSRKGKAGGKRGKAKNTATKSTAPPRTTRSCRGQRVLQLKVGDDDDAFIPDEEDLFVLSDED